MSDDNSALDKLAEIFGDIDDKTAQKGPPALPGKKKKPPALPKTKSLKYLSYFVQKDTVDACIRKIPPADNPELINSMKDLRELSRNLERYETLVCFTDEQRFKIGFAYYELVENVEEMIEKFPDSDFEKINNCQKLFKEMKRELTKIKKDTKAKKKIDLVEFIDALAESLEIIGFDKEKLSVEKVAKTNMNKELFLPGSKVTLTLVEVKNSVEGERFTLSFNLKS
ncbi:MAG: hypothetical protein HRT89_24135 [Lentisphaeria bacterium]|nr:hypothetical protein [Lentisphaeria bacterium]NQZ71148.1 hypothetical protein [Lentisphaeria bacterium]